MFTLLAILELWRKVQKLILNLDRFKKWTQFPGVRAWCWLYQLFSLLESWFIKFTSIIFQHLLDDVHGMKLLTYFIWLWKARGKHWENLPQVFRMFLSQSTKCVNFLACLQMYKSRWYCGKCIQTKLNLSSFLLSPGVPWWHCQTTFLVMNHVKAFLTN